MDAIGWMFPPEAAFTRPKGGPDRIEQVFYSDRMAKEQLFELARRTFDTPEFRGIECIEVEAKSVINKVPGNAMPFDWTINPYRGCVHACVYCFARPTHTYLDMNAGRDFETKVVVKVKCSVASSPPSGGRASTSRWGRTPIRISGSRAAIS
jgi:hypothetical protein